MNRSQPWAYGLVKLWAAAQMHGFYRVLVSGPDCPASRPLLVVANHQNGLADGALLILAVRRPLRFLVKYKLLRMPILGWIVSSVGALPVYRQKDGVDRSKNSEAFRAVHAALALGSAVAIFPEGSSHSEPRLSELKTGVARLALGALLEHGPGLELAILPVALHYEDRDRFQSRVEIQRGSPIEVAPYASPQGAEDREAVTRLMERVRAELADLSAALPEGIDRPDFEALARCVQGVGPHSGAERQRLARKLRRRSARGRPLEFSRARARADTPAAPLAPGWRHLAALPWGPPLWLGTWIGLRFRPTPDKYVTTRVLALNVLLPAWALLSTWLVRSFAKGLLWPWLVWAVVGGIGCLLASRIRF